MEDKLCPVCKEIKDVSKFQTNPDGTIRKHVCMACYGKKERAQLKLDALKAFGFKCQCCGENHPYFLSLDHKDNDGAEHRESLNEQQIYREARREGWPTEKYQLLCMNCNFAKGHFNECPHKLNISAEDAIKTLEAKIFLTGKQYRNHNTSNLPEARNKMVLNSFSKKLQNLSKVELDLLWKAINTKTK